MKHFNTLVSPQLTPQRLIRFSYAVIVTLITLFGQLATAQTAQLTAPTTASALKAMQWRNIGPFRGGRSVAVAGHPTERLVFYMGTTGGGVWKTENGGITWQNISDGFFKTGSVGAIAVAQSSPNVIYVGMGEHTLRGNLAHGDGMYKSTDGGKTWVHVGLADTYHIGSVIIDPTNPDIVYVAALGHAFGPNEERGVFRTQDGGKTWQKVLYKNPNVGAIDLTIDPANPKTLYASTFEFRRFPWGVRSAGPGAGIHKSTDGGTTWTDITRNTGLPTGTNRGRIGLALSPSKPNRVWAIIEAENEQTGVYRTDDGGATWQLVSQFADLFQRPWYYHHLKADPKDSETLWVLNIDMWKSGDGGKTYKKVEPPHGDNHQLWIDPNDTNRMVQANDGGGTVTFDGGKSWSTIYNQPTAQMYHVITDNKFPYRVYGAQQDNSTISVPSRSDYGAIYPNENYDIGGGESGYIAFDKNEPSLIYAANHHWLTRLNLKTKQLKDVSVIPDDMYGYGSADLAYRFQWTYPVLVSPHNPKVLYATSQYVHRSTDQGMSWQIISPNLSRSDPSTLEKTPTMDDQSIGKDWGPIKRDNTGVEWYGTIFALAESPIKAGVLWSGSDDGYVQLSTDNGKTWKNVTPKDMPDFARISSIDPSAHDPATAYVAALKYKQDDFHPYVFKTSDYGKTWTKITQGIGETDFVRVVREDPKRRGLLYAGAEKGMYVSFNDGGQWQSLQLNLPIVPIHDLAIQDNDLVAATHGRSFWILDDLTILHQLTDEVQKSAVHLFKPRSTVRFRAALDPAIKPVPNGASELGKNPANGVKVVYYLAEKPNTPITLTFFDASGQLIKLYKTAVVTPPVAQSASKDSTVRAEIRQPAPPARREATLPAEVGGNAFVWEDMRYPDPIALPNSVTHGRARGPLAMPGKYTAQLVVDGKTYTQEFDIIKDPRIQTTPEEFKLQFDMLIKIRERINELRNGVLSIRKMRQQLDSAYHNQDDQSIKELKDQMLRIEDELYQYRAKATQDLTNHPVRLNTKFTALSGFVESDDSRPTQQQNEQYNVLTKKLTEQLQKLETVKTTVQRKLRPNG